MPSNHLILHSPLFLLPSILPRIRAFSNQLFASGGQSIGASSSASVLPMNFQGLFPLGLTGLTSLLSKGLPKVFSSTTVRRNQFSGVQSSLWTNSYIHTSLLEKSQLWLYGPLSVKRYLCFLKNKLSMFVIAFLPRSKCFLISWLQSPSVVILEPRKIKSVTISVVSPFICHEVMVPDAMILVFWKYYLVPFIWYK